MGWHIVFSTRSRQDLQQIVEYIARDNPAAAERFGLALIDRAGGGVARHSNVGTGGGWFRGARSSRVLVSASRRSELP